MTLSPVNSQKLFRELELSLCEVRDQLPDFRGSFHAFCNWLETDRADVITRAKTIAEDVRLWRDTQDVLWQLWEHVYQG